MIEIVSPGDKPWSIVVYSETNEGMAVAAGHGYIQILQR